MSYPQAVATGNAVIAAALEWDDAMTAYGHAVFDADEAEAEARYGAARDALDDAIAAHRAATAVEHVQGPDIDASS